MYGRRLTEGWRGVPPELQRPRPPDSSCGDLGAAAGPVAAAALPILEVRVRGEMISSCGDPFHPELRDTKYPRFRDVSLSDHEQEKSLLISGHANGRLDELVEIL